MGNSLLDIIVFGRIAGANAAEFALGSAQDGALNLEQAAAFAKLTAASSVRFLCSPVAKM